MHPFLPWRIWPRPRGSGHVCFWPRPLLATSTSGHVRQPWRCSLPRVKQFYQMCTDFKSSHPFDALTFCHHVEPSFTSGYGLRFHAPCGELAVSRRLPPPADTAFVAAPGWSRDGFARQSTGGRSLETGAHSGAGCGLFFMALLFSDAFLRLALRWVGPFPAFSPRD